MYKFLIRIANREDPYQNECAKIRLVFSSKISFQELTEMLTSNPIKYRYIMDYLILIVFMYGKIHQNTKD